MGESSRTFFKRGGNMGTHGFAFLCAFCFSKMKVLIELPYLPPVAWFAQIWEAEEVVLEACEHFQKGTYRNRCEIAGANGRQLLSVPLEKGKNAQMPIREVRIAYHEKWQQVHWRSIQAAYGNAPFFEHYGPELAVFYEKYWATLFELNMALLQFLLKKFRWPGQLGFSESYLEKGSSNENWQDFRDQISPKNPPPEWLAQNRYPQVFEDRHGFLPNLSALDLLFCWGKNVAEKFQPLS